MMLIDKTCRQGTIYRGVQRLISGATLTASNGNVIGAKAEPRADPPLVLSVRLVCAVFL